jgi:hypothetical protein
MSLYRKGIFISIAAFLSVSILGLNKATAEEKLTFKSVVKFSGGIIAGFMVHEAGHALAGVLTGTDMNWECGDINQPFKFTEEADSDAKGFIINSAGFITQAASAEVILRYDKVDKNDAFARGMMTWNILNPIFYAVDYWFIEKTNQINGDSYMGDLAGIEHYTNETVANLFAVGIVAVAVSQGYRFVKTQTWAPEWIKDDSHSLSFRPLRSGSFVMTYTIAF